VVEIEDTGEDDASERTRIGVTMLGAKKGSMGRALSRELGRIGKEEDMEMGESYIRLFIASHILPS
tara:strand:- start:8805 stop:9002 length:198 start_codon:yes stop_codon:yes gene_type:complete